MTDVVTSIARMILVCSFAVGVSLGCQVDDQTDSETHWQRALHACDQDSDCRNGMSCLCGMCTQQCASDESVCESISGAAVCVSEPDGVAALCNTGGSTPSSLCARECAGPPDCPDQQACTIEGHCRPQDTANNDTPDSDLLDSEGESCEVYCDLTDPVTLYVQVEDIAGNTYCEDTYDVTSGVLETPGSQFTRQCQCGSFVYPDGGSPDVGFNESRCHFNYWPGDQVELQVDAPGYDIVTEQVSIQCECASEQTVTVTLPE